MGALGAGAVEMIADAHRDRRGEESLDRFTGHTAVATADLLGQQAPVFPSHHGGFLGGEFRYAGQIEAFARKLHQVLDRA